MEITLQKEIDQLKANIKSSIVTNCFSAYLGQYRVIGSKQGKEYSYSVFSKTGQGHKVAECHSETELFSFLTSTKES